MKFQIEVGTKGAADAWWETFDKEEVTDEATARKWARETIQRFNNTIQNPNEKPRRFAGGVKILGEGTKVHRWSKTSTMTQQDHRGMFDKVKCTRCGAVARRYELTRIVMQKGYTAKKWKLCPGDAHPDIGESNG